MHVSFVGIVKPARADIVSDARIDSGGCRSCPKNDAISSYKCITHYILSVKLPKIGGMLFIF